MNPALPEKIKTLFPGLVHWFRLPGFVSWIAVSAGIAAGFVVPWRFFPTHPSPARSILVPVLIMSALFCGVLARRAWKRLCAFFLAALLVCLSHRSRQAEVYNSLAPVIQNRTLVTLYGKIQSAPMPWHENYHFLFKVDSAAEGSAARLQGLTLECITPRDPPQYGRAQVRGSLEPPALRMNPYERDGFSAAMATGVWGTLRSVSCVLSSERPSLLERLSRAFRAAAVAALRKIEDYDNRALLQASFLGDTEFLSPYVNSLFRKAGIYHLIAISGLNTAMLTAALYFFLRLFPIGRIAPHLICLTALWLYLLFVGSIPSLFRATVMTSCVIAALLFQKKNYAMQTIGLAGTVWLLLSPESLFDAGCQLSFAATAGLLTLFPVLNRWTPRIRWPFANKAGAFLFGSFYVSLASFLATAPILLYHFGTISYFSLVANLAAVSAMTVSMWAFFAGLFLQMVFPWAASLPLWVSERFMDVVTATGRWAQYFSWSQASYPVPPPEIIALYSLFLAGVVTIDRKRVRAYLGLCCAAALVFVPIDLLIRRSPRDLEAVCFSLPRTSALGVRWPGGQTWLFAAEPGKLSPLCVQRSVLPWLRHRSSGRFEALCAPQSEGVRAALLAASLPQLAPAALHFLPSAKRGQGQAPNRDRFATAEPGSPDWMSVRFFPCEKCTCDYALRNGEPAVRIAAAGAESLFVLSRPSSSGRGRAREIAPSEETAAKIVSFHHGEIRRASVVRPGHPLGRLRPPRP